MLYTDSRSLLPERLVRSKPIQAQLGKHRSWEMSDEKSGLVGVLPLKIAPATQAALDGWKIVFLAAYAMMLWSFAWAIIHFAGPHGLFAGAQHVLLYAMTIPVTMLTNLQSRRRAGLPKSQTLTAVAMTSFVAMFADSLVFGWFPWIYSTDSDVARAGAAWLLWAIAVALVLAVISATDADARQ
jgi:hypothetical protein